MKVLWFTSSHCGSAKRSGTPVYRGWMTSLESEVKKHTEIELHVCFISKKTEEDFVFDGVHYHPVIREQSASGIKRILDRFSFSRERDDARMLPQLIDAVRKVEPDIIHIHGTEECFGLIEDYVKDTPIVVSIQGLIAPYSEKYYSGYPSEFVNRHEPWSNKLRGLGTKYRFKDFQARGSREMHFLQNTKYVIGRTQFDHFVPLLCNPKVKIFQGEEILRPDFYEAVWDKKEFGDPLKIVSTISGGVYKGYETALHTATLLKQYADFDFEWNIIGYDCNSEWVHLAEKYTGFSSTESNINLLGRKTASEMVDILTNCDIYVQVSHIENSPNSLCEAMLLGMPIIASFAGGTSSMLKDGEEGILVQDGEPYTLGGAIVALASDFTLATSLGKKASLRARKRHSPKTIGNALLNTYKIIIENCNKLCTH